MKALGAIEVKTWEKVRRLPSGVMQMFEPEFLEAR